MRRRISDHRALAAYVAAGFSMIGAARRLGVSSNRIKGALERIPLANYLAREEQDFQGRKFKLLGELSRLEIER